MRGNNSHIVVHTHEHNTFYSIKVSYFLFCIMFLFFYIYYVRTRKFIFIPLLMDFCSILFQMSRCDLLDYNRKWFINRCILYLVKKRTGPEKCCRNKVEQQIRNVFGNTLLLILFSPPTLNNLYFFRAVRVCWNDTKLHMSNQSLYRLRTI